MPLSELTPIQQLDEIFKVIKNDYGSILEDALIKRLIPFVISKEEFLRCMEKLISDKYVVKYIDEQGRAILYYCTFAGYLFEGYENEHKFKALEGLRLETTIAFQQKQVRSLNQLTKIIAVGTGVAALYYLYLLWQELCWCEFLWQKHP